VTQALTVAPLQETEYGRWAELVAASPDGSPYALAEYLDLLCRAAGGRFRILALRRGDELLGGVPLYETPTRTGPVVGPRLLLYYLGPVLRRWETRYPSIETSRSVAALDLLAGAIERRRYAKVVLKGRHTLSDVRPFLARGWSAWPSYSYLVPLHDLAAQRNRVEQNLRRLIERARAAAITVADDDDFDSYLRLHEMTMRRHGAALYLPPPAFRRWFEGVRAAGIGRLYQARLPDGTSVAAQIVLKGGHPVSHTVTAATDPAHRQSGVAAWLRWRVFELEAARGANANDLTDAALNPVTHFKSQLGGDLVLNLVVETPGSLRWNLGQRMAAGYRSVRGLAGSLRRRLAQ
jgi:hypothetical protein